MYFPKGKAVAVIELKLNTSVVDAFTRDIYVEKIETWISCKAWIGFQTGRIPVNTTSKLVDILQAPPSNVFSEVELLYFYCKISLMLFT